MKLPGCEILGRAARTLAPLTNFSKDVAVVPNCYGNVNSTQMNKGNCHISTSTAPSSTQFGGNGANTVFYNRIEQSLIGMYFFNTN